MNNMFGGLGGLMKGLSAFMPQDDPETKVLLTQNEISELSQKEQALYAEIGKCLIEIARTRSDTVGMVEELHIVQRELAQAQQKLQQAQMEKDNHERMEQEKRDALTCPQCGTVHEEGIKFCQQCGAKLGLPIQAACKKCGHKNPPETRFCGECGAKL